MNRYYPYGSPKDSYDGNLELSRADLWVLGTLLGVFAAVMASGLLQESGSNLVWPWVTTLVVASGAVASFWGALRWRGEARREQEEPRQLDRFHDSSIAA